MSPAHRYLYIQGFPKVVARVNAKKISRGQTHVHTGLLLYIYIYIYTRLGQKGVNFGNSLTASGVCHMSSKDEDAVKYFGKKIVFTSAQLDLKFMY